MAEPTLKKGSKGQAVKDLQEALNALGYEILDVDGEFGPQTEEMVKAFQAAVGIDVDGIVGPITWRNIDEADQSEPLLKKGAKGLPVRRLQSRMRAVGYDVEVDGRFGPKTEAAVKQLQKAYDLDVDGIVGPKTWAVVAALEDEGSAA